MNKEIKEKWIDALLNGDYEQGKGCLRDNQDNFCCLGVLTDIAAKEGIVEWTKKFDSCNEFSVLEKDLNCLGDKVYEKDALPEEVRIWAGLDDSNPMIDMIETEIDEEGEEVQTNSLAEANDNGMTFEEIAEIIKEQL